MTLKVSKGRKTPTQQQQQQQQEMNLSEKWSLTIVIKALKR